MVKEGMDKFEAKRKARWQALQESRRKRRLDVRALTKIYSHAEVARRMGISRQRVHAIWRAAE